MILRLCPKVLEDRLLPVPLHMIPIVYHAVTNRIMHTISGCLRICQSLVADEEIEIFDSTLRC